MANIVILGAGVMGSALAVPASKQNSNSITLVGSPLDDDWIASVRATRYHPALQVNLPEHINAITESSLTIHQLQAADVIVIAVSSPGVSWAVSVLQKTDKQPALIALVTKGLVACDHDKPPLTYADALPLEWTRASGPLVGIGGPCIARELAMDMPTQVVFASRNNQAAEHLRELLQTPTYRIAVSEDIVGVEACAALKNFMCIGVSAMLSRYRVGESYAKNPLAAAFNQAVLEMAGLVTWLRRSAQDSAEISESRRSAVGQRPDAAFDLAGMGDLHVTVGGGRNSRLGVELGRGHTLSAVLAGSMLDVTVEGVDTGRVLSQHFRAACAQAELEIKDYPLTESILDCIENDTPFTFDFQALSA